MTILTGACLCGAIAYEIKGSLGPIVNCHCAMCRRWHGAAFRTRASVKSSQFRWLRGEDQIAQYPSSPDNVRCFCKVCGSNLISIDPHHPETIGLPLGGLDQDPGNRPLAHLFVASKSPWFEITDGLPQFDGFPPPGEFGLNPPAASNGKK